MAISDIALIVIVGLFFIVGFIKGFTKSMLTFFGTLASLLLAFLLCKKFVAFLDNSFGLLDKCSALFKNWLPKMGEYMNYPVTDKASLDTALSKAGIPSFLRKAVNNLILPLIESDSLAEGTTLADTLAPLFGYYMLTVISFVALFIIGKLVFFILNAFLQKAIAFKPLKAADKLLGGALGLVKAALTVYVLLLIISILPGKLIAPVQRDIDKSTAVKYLSDTNLIGNIINKVIDYTLVRDKITDGDDSQARATEISCANNCRSQSQNIKRVCYMAEYGGERIFI